VKWLLNKGAKIDEATGKLGSALQAASLQGKLGVVEILLAEGADVNVIHGRAANMTEVRIFPATTKIFNSTIFNAPFSLLFIYQNASI
jgi:hypothetical protein